MLLQKSLKATLLLLVLQLLVSLINAQVTCCGNLSGGSCGSSTPTSCPDPSGDPHYYTVCLNGNDLRFQCPNGTLYISNNPAANNYSPDYEGCAPWQLFPWSPDSGLPPASMEPVPCIGAALMHGVPYSDPSYYWQCSSAFGTAVLSQCPTGFGFSNGPSHVGCTDWSEWNL